MAPSYTSDTDGPPLHADFLGKPWKYVGYRQFAPFIASDDELFILRRFSTLTARVLLALQDELSELEEQLSTIDAHLADPHQPDIHNGSFRQETSMTRLELIKEIDCKLRSFNELVLQHSDIRARPKVPRMDITSVSRWLNKIHPKAILDAETRYINHRSDLFAMSPKHKAPLRRLLEKSSRFRQSRLWQKESEVKDEYVIYTSDDRINYFVGLINTILGLAMLITPLWILTFVDEKAKRIAIITGFLISFFSLVSFTTVVKPFESLGATAAYAAVLVVFLQINP